MTLKISTKQKRRQLIEQANLLKEEIDYAEYKLPSVLKSIVELNPTKAELKDGLQDLFDEYLY